MVERSVLRAAEHLLNRPGGLHYHLDPSSRPIEVRVSVFCLPGPSEGVVGMDALYYVPIPPLSSHGIGERRVSPRRLARLVRSGGDRAFRYSSYALRREG